MIAAWRESPGPSSLAQMHRPATLVALGVKPIDVGVALKLVKSAVSDLMPIRRLSIRNRVERGTIHDLPASDLTTRLDTLITWARKGRG